MLEVPNDGGVYGGDVDVHLTTILQLNLYVHKTCKNMRKYRGCRGQGENRFKTFLRPIQDHILGNIRPIDNVPISK